MQKNHTQKSSSTPDMIGKLLPDLTHPPIKPINSGEKILIYPKKHEKVNKSRKILEQHKRNLDKGNGISCYLFMNFSLRAG